MSKTEKPHLNLVVIGHVDHGKSTTVGHLFYLTGTVDERTAKVYEEEAKKLAMGLEKVKAFIENKQVVKEIYIPEKLVNIVVK